jgi:SH3-like domain-containing protein
MVSEPDEAEAETPPDVASPVAVATGRIYAPGFNGVNLRRTPSTTAATIRVLPVGTTVAILSGQAIANGLVWQQVRATNGEVGWVSAGTVLR